MTLVPEISVVIPAYGEAANIPALLQKLSKVLGECTQTFEIIIVDDGSVDSTWEVLKNHLSKPYRLRAVRLSRNFGKENAICAGLEIAEGNGVIVMDCDLQHPPECIPQLINRWRAGDVEIVEAVKKTRGSETSAHRFGARMFYYIFGRLSEFDIQSATDFKIIDRTVLNAWKSMGERVTFFRGMIVWLGFRREVIHIDPIERSSGQSHWPMFSLCRLAINALTSFTSIPLRFVTIMGAVSIAFTIGLGVQTLYMKFSGKALDGFTTVIICILFVGAVLMFSLGIIGEYIAQIYHEVKQRPRYVVREVI